MKSRFTAIIIWSVLIASATEAWAQTDSLYLDATTVTARRKEAVAITGSAGVTVDVSSMKTLPSILGTPDPVAYAQYLPSMSTNSELDAGIHIQGNDHSHNVVSSGGVPIYGVSHLLGLFSVFNPSHFGKMRYRTSSPELNRLGGSLDMMLPDSLPKTLKGEFQAGLIAAQGSLSVPVGDVGVKVSARRSYLNLLYGNYIKVNDIPIRYGFTDANITVVWAPGAKDKLWLDAYWGADALDGAAGLYGADGSSAWDNAMAALHWKHGALTQTAYYTGWSLGLDAAWTSLSARLDSHLRSAGYKAAFRSGDWTVRAESAWHNALPQNPIIKGGPNVSNSEQPEQSAWENVLSGRYSHTWGPFTLETGLKGCMYLSPEREWMPSADPDLSLGWNLYRGGALALKLGTQHQYLFQTGFTDMGMPSEFWFLAGKNARPQESRYVSLSYLLDFGQGGYTLSAETYFKRLYGQVEYKDNILDLISREYSLDNVLLHGNGRAWGLNLSLSKVSGAFTGWISYAWGRSLRRFDDPDYAEEYPSSHERIHELDAVASYRLGRWNFGATLVAASGTPYTRPEHLYIMSGQIIAKYGKHNGARLAPYFRVDASATYNFKPDVNGLTLSVYNATCRENELFHRISIDKEEGTYRYKSSNLIFSILPTISYFHKF